MYVRRRLHYVPRSPTLVRRGLYEASLCLAGAAGLPRTRPDVIVGVVPSLADAAVARLASTVYRRPYGLVFQDLMGPAVTQANDQHTVGAGLARVEGGLASGAAAVAIVAGGFRGYLERSGVEPARIHRVRNWADYTPPTASRQATRRGLDWGHDEVICLYAGALGTKQGLEVLLQAAALLSGTPARIVLAGDGGARRALEEQARTLGASVAFLPPNPSGEYEARLEAADILLLTQRGTVAEMSLASKLGSYLTAGRPIVGAVAAGSETGRELARTGAGVLVEPEHPEAVAAAIRELAADPKRRETLGDVGREFALTHLSRSTAIEEYEEFLDVLLSCRRGGTLRTARVAGQVPKGW